MKTERKLEVYIVIKGIQKHSVMLMVKSNVIKFIDIGVYINNERWKVLFCHYDNGAIFNDKKVVDTKLFIYVLLQTKHKKITKNNEKKETSQRETTVYHNIIVCTFLLLFFPVIFRFSHNMENFLKHNKFFKDKKK